MADVFPSFANKRASPPEDEKLKTKRAKLEAWKKERDAKKSIDEAKVKAMALACKFAVPGEFYIHLHTRHDFTPLDPLHSTGFFFCYRQRPLVN